MGAAEFRRFVKDVGKFDAILYLLSRALFRVTWGHVRLLHYYITAQPVPVDDALSARRGQQIVVSEATPAEILSAAIDRPRHVLESRLANKCRCLLARQKGNLVGFQWFALDDYQEDEVRCIYELARGDRCAWDFDIFVAAESRLQPVFAKLWDACNQALRQAGMTLTLSRINAFNGPSRRAHQRIGAKLVGHAFFLCAGRLQVAAFSAEPWLHVSIRDSDAPLLHASRMARRHFA